MNQSVDELMEDHTAITALSPDSSTQLHSFQKWWRRMHERVKRQWMRGVVGVDVELRELEGGLRV